MTHGIGLENTSVHSDHQFRKNGSWAPEWFVQRSLEATKHGTTAVRVPRRSATVMNMEVIFVLEDHQLENMELLAWGEQCASLVRFQLQYTACWNHFINGIGVANSLVVRIIPGIIGTFLGWTQS
jgi:hypothetical protein